MDTQHDSGLSVYFDDESGIITLDWNEDTHPEWNFLNGLTSEQFCQIIQNYLDDLKRTNSAEVPAG